MRVLSLGWGTQSTALAVMAALGDIEPVDFAIHADTTHERTATYEYAKMLTPWLEARGVRVVTAKTNKPQSIDEWGGVSIPAYTISPKNTSGMLRRQCTHDWKIMPIRRKLQELRNGDRVKMLMGISTDEFQRMKLSGVKYIVNEYPLIYKRMSRHDCIQYLKRAGVSIPSRSACVFCPYHHKSDWRYLKDNYLSDWNKAILVDKNIRHATKPGYQVYVCNQRKPLPECDFSTPQDHWTA